MLRTLVSFNPSGMLESSYVAQIHAQGTIVEVIIHVFIYLFIYFSKPDKAWSNIEFEYSSIRQTASSFVSYVTIILLFSFH